MPPEKCGHFKERCTGMVEPHSELPAQQNGFASCPRAERRQFARWFYEHENQIVEPREGDEISVATKAEILRRSAELDANPGLAVPVTGEWFEQLKRRLADGTSQASAR